MFRLLVHGGAGTIERAAMTEEREAAYRRDLEAALSAGHEILSGGGVALDAVEAAVRAMEDSPLFNAGRGAVFTHDGEIELDASIMDGRDARAGAVAAVRGVKNPITAARRVMERSPHVLLIGDGAAAFAREKGVEFAPVDYFETEFRRRQLEKARGDDVVGLDHSIDVDEGSKGTVGAVALDEHGHLAAATSTGGMTNKRYGRVGDSAVIGAGTWADARCAVSSTGHGEIFLRVAAARDVAARVEYAGNDLESAAAATVARLAALGGDDVGGLIAVGVDGRFTLPFQSKGMYRGWIDEAGRPEVRIYGDGE